MIVKNNLPTLLYRHQVNKTLSFYQTDEEELFYENVKKYGKDWYYYDNPIEYKFNNWG